MKEVVDGDQPQRHEVTRILDEMFKIAKKDMEGEPVVDYDGQMSELRISAPYFAFFLKWRATQELDERSKAIMPRLTSSPLAAADQSADAPGLSLSSKGSDRYADSGRASQWKSSVAKRKGWKDRRRKGKR